LQITRAEISEILKKFKSLRSLQLGLLKRFDETSAINAADLACVLLCLTMTVTTQRDC
jgi:hypothetical protein